MVETAETSGSPSGAGQGEDHARSDIERRVGSGKCGSENHEVHDCGGMRNFDCTESGDEGTFGDAGMVPGHHAQEDDDRAHIYEGESEKSQPDGAGSFFWRKRFAGSDRDHFDSAETVNGESHGYERRPGAVGKESALRVVLRRYTTA